MVANCKPIFPVILAAALLLQGCVNQKNTTANCLGGIEVSFYSMSRCETERSYPDGITDISLFVFDGNDILVAHSRTTDITFDRDLRISAGLPAGLYTVLAWSGLDEYFFQVNGVADGTTLRGDLLFSLRRTAGEAIGTEGIKLYHGQSRAVYVSGEDEEYIPVTVNMLEVTNRINITVEGLPLDASYYEVSVEADNGSMNIDGTIAPDEDLAYQAVYLPGTGVLGAAFTTLKLETGHNYTIVISNPGAGTELFRGSLLGALILLNPEVDLNCDHDFDIRFTAEDVCECGTYIITEIWINDWLVHSYNKDL